MCYRVLLAFAASCLISSATFSDDDLVSGLIPQGDLVSGLVPEVDPQPELWFYFTDWCVHCERMEPALAAMEDDGYVIVPVDCTGKNYDDIPSVPICRFYIPGTEVGLQAAPEIAGYASEDRLREVMDALAAGEPVPEGQQADTANCMCRGSSRGVCLCLQEIAAGLRTKQCGCRSNTASVHYMEDGRPVGATGEYVRLQGR